MKEKITYSADKRQTFRRRLILRLYNNLNFNHRAAMKSVDSLVDYLFENNEVDEVLLKYDLLSKRIDNNIKPKHIERIIECTREVMSWIEERKSEDLNK